jgi:hypothetical protein
LSPSAIVPAAIIAKTNVSNKSAPFPPTPPT